MNIQIEKGASELAHMLDGEVESITIRLDSKTNKIGDYTKEEAEEIDATLKRNGFTKKSEYSLGTVTSRWYQKGKVEIFLSYK